MNAQLNRGVRQILLAGLAAILYSRIQQAAFAIGDGGFVGPFSEIRTKTSACYENAVAQVYSPQLSALHQNQDTRIASK